MTNHRLLALLPALLACEPSATDGVDSPNGHSETGGSPCSQARLLLSPEPGIWNFDFTPVTNTLFAEDPTPAAGQATITGSTDGEISIFGLFPQDAADSSGPNWTIGPGGAFDYRGEGTGGAYPGCGCDEGVGWEWSIRYKGRFTACDAVEFTVVLTSAFAGECLSTGDYLPCATATYQNIMFIPSGVEAASFAGEYSYAAKGFLDGS